MARYPIFEEYQERGNFEDGIKRCDDLLKKNTNDIQLLTVKLQLLYAAKSEEGARQVLNQVLSIQPPVQDLRELVAIEEAVIDSQSDAFPLPKTAGPELAKLWENAFKAAAGSVNQKLDLQSLRFSRAIVNNRIADAQQALIQLKALQPRNRIVYMEHAAVTQLLSTAKEDLQSRLAISLARKAVMECFDDDKSLDCRVPGQIFALQGSRKDLDGLGERAFGESKQVHDVLRKAKVLEINGDSMMPEREDAANVSAGEWLASEVQILKQQFSQLIESSAAVETIASFAANSIRLFHTSITSLAPTRSRAATDACFLAISALVRAFEQTNESRRLRQAAYLAETLLKQNPHIHEARLILIYLYARLGLGSLAMRLFDSLNVKEVQHDTVGHALFTRLPLIHPQSTPLTKADAFDPSKRTTQALSVYTRCEEKLAENAASVLSHGQTGMIFDLHELRESLRLSITRRILHLEQRRLDRVLQIPYKDTTSRMGARVTANWLDTIDNRDFAATFNYGYDIEKVLHGVHSVPPGKQWILYSLAVDSAWCLAAGHEPPINDPETLLEELEITTPDMSRLQLNDQASPALEMTGAEFLAGDLACQVLRLLLGLQVERAAQLSENVTGVRKAVERIDLRLLWNTDETLGLPERLSDCYVYLDVMRIVYRACGLVLASKQAGECETDLVELQGTANGICHGIQRFSGEQAKMAKGAGIKTLVVEKKGSGIGEGLRLFGENGVRDFCEIIAKSAREGWDGLARMKVSWK